MSFWASRRLLTPRVLVGGTVLGIILWSLPGCGESTKTSEQPIVSNNGGAGQGGASGQDGGVAGQGTGGSSGYDGGVPDAPPVPDDAKAMLAVYQLDLWGRPLTDSGAQLSVTTGGQSATTQATGWVTYVPLKDAATYDIELSAPEYRDLAVSVVFDGSTDLSAATLSYDKDSEAGQGLSFAHKMDEVHGKTLPVHSLFLGLRHKWFSAEGRPPRAGNEIELYMSGQDAWASVYKELKQSSKRVEISTWWWESNFELIRKLPEHATLSESERWKNTILGVLEDQKTVKRVLVGEFWSQDSILSWMTTDKKLRAYAEQGGDDFEFMGMANETNGKFYFEPTPFVFGDRVRANIENLDASDFDPEDKIHSEVPARDVDLTEWPTGLEANIASWHQKFMVIDDETAFIGGMNLRRVDWDTMDHKVFDERRELFGASQSDRQKVIDRKKQPDNGPRKDYMMRIHGPAAQDAAEVFKFRWDHQLAEKVTYSEYASPFDVERNIPAYGDKLVQVTATMPKPFWEHAIAETWFNAVQNAEHYIYIEDQYFRMPMVDDVIVKRMKQVPDLKLIVITKAINEWTDPGCEWTAKENRRFEVQFPDRYQVLKFASFDYVDVGWGIDETNGYFVDMDTHSKILIVDDKFMSVGSANKNNRGIVYEGELNVAVLDPVWVKQQRRRIFENVLPKSATPTDDVDTWWQQFKSAAAWNDSVRAKWKQEDDDLDLDGKPLPKEYTPEGFVYSLSLPVESECAIENVGPDMMTRDED